MGRKRKACPFGVIDGGIVVADPRFLEEAKAKMQTFGTVPEADAAAKAAGWQVADAEGANHRCPRCIEDPEHVNRRGAFIRWDRQRQADGPQSPAGGKA